MSDEPFDPDAMPAWIQELWPSLGRPSDIVAGINDDDCAVLKTREGLLILTTDFLNANPIGVQLGIATPRDLGRLVVAANLSDLCGTGADPRALLIALTLPRDSKTDDFREIMLGVRQEAGRWQVPVVGGDTKLGRARALLAVAVGYVESERDLFMRNRARVGDQVWLSGQVGSCSAATVGLSQSFGDGEWRRWARRVILEPDLPLSKSRRLSQAQLAHGGTDLSDGLAAALEAICTSSDVGVVIDCAAIPVADEVLDLAQNLSAPSWSFALAGGGDFQFLVTAPPESGRELEAMGFWQCGTVTSDRRRVLRLAERAVEVQFRGHRDARNLSFAEEILELIGPFRNIADGAG